ncbi:MAG: threonine--tRNA ligase [Candidatus Sumerlaeota bacterium]
MSVSASPITITLPDGSTKSFDAPLTAGEVAASIGAGLAKAAIAAKVNGKVVDLNHRIDVDAEVAIITAKSPESLEVLRHSCTHLMAQAIKRIRPEAMLEDGPPTEEGFWYDIRTVPPLTPEDFPAIEKEMEAIVKENLAIERRVLSRGEAKQLFAERNEKYKLDLIDRIPEGDTISAYAQGEFIDLCRGPHVPTTGIFKAFKLTAVAGAYWKGDANNEQLTRVKGTAFHSKKELDESLARIEEAKKRDHRKLGRELELFMHHDWAPGETIWLPKGHTMYSILGTMMSDLCREEGYVEVFTAMLFKADLFKTSGHWSHYRDNMFVVPGQETKQLTEAETQSRIAAIETEAGNLLSKNEFEALKEKVNAKTSGAEKLSVWTTNDKISTKFWNVFERGGSAYELHESGNEVFALKAMNCPCHMLIFRDQKRSYRELPLRIHDQGVLHRNEASGTLSGLTRVRQFCQDDAHIFLSQDMIEGEITKLISMIRRVYTVFGMEFAKVFLSTRPTDFLGAKETWDVAEASLENAIKANKLEYQVNAGDGAFYGPKIDFIVRDCLGREWQTATVQLDYQLPARFELSFVNRDNKPEMPVVVHRAIFGSFERFMAILIEHYGGNFPVWLAPTQVRILTISEKFEDYANDLFKQLSDRGVRVEKDFTAEKIGSKIREGRNARIPYLLTVGEKEVASNSVSARSQTEGELGSLAFGDFLTRIDKEKVARF